MSALYTGELLLEDVRTEFRLKFGPQFRPWKCWEQANSVEPLL